jgi:hypothetical protein
MSETRTCTWSPGIPELECEGSISEAIREGSTKFRMQITPEVWEGIRGSQRIAVIDPDAWRMEATVEDVRRVDDETVELTLAPADFMCDRCGGSGEVDGVTGDEYDPKPCDLCEDGRIPAHAIKGEYFVPGLGVVDGPGPHAVPCEESLTPPREVPAQWRPSDS